MEQFARRIGIAATFVTMTWAAGSLAVHAEDLSSREVATSVAPKSDNAVAGKGRQKPKLDRSGKSQTGKASFYGRKFYGRKMADGTRMDPNSNVAASKTLPLGTRARVTNLENGKTAVVEIRDRGPYVPGRILDVSPSTAEILDMKADGVASVRVTPITMPDVKGATRTALAD